MHSPLKYSEEHGREQSYRLLPSSGIYAHRFGGDSWTTHDKSLLVTLDLNDPKLSGLGSCGLSELPLCSNLKPGGWENRQEYVINSQKKEVFVMDSQNNGFHESSDGNTQPNPLPSIPVELENLCPNEYPIDEEHYWKCCDEFLGGNACFRVLGRPLWLQSPQWPKNASGEMLSFVMCMGYEAWNGPFRYLGDRPLFIGEGALYFFFCCKSLTMTVISQSS